MNQLLQTPLAFGLGFFVGWVFTRAFGPWGFVLAAPVAYLVGAGVSKVFS